MWVSSRGLTSEEWRRLFPMVQELAAQDGLVGSWQPDTVAEKHDVRFTSPDGRSLMFGSAVATVIRGTVVCRRHADAPPS